MKNPQNIALAMIALICILVIGLAWETHEGLKSNAEYNKPIHDTVTVQSVAYKNVCNYWFTEGVMSPIDIRMENINDSFEVEWNKQTLTPIK